MPNAPRNIVREYYQLTKPRLIYGNLLTTLAAYLFASGWAVSWSALFGVLAGIALVIGSGCVFNNYMDRGIDAKMERTKQRALVTGAISPRSALAYGVILGIIGLGLLYFLANALTALVALGGFIVYVFVYGWAKRAGSAGAIIGSLSGAVPILAGYIAATNRLDAIALILFLILVIWQIPHFYSIATYRADEYAAAAIPTVPAVRGARWTRYSIVSYILVYLIELQVLGAFTGYIPIFIAEAFGALWLWQATKGFRHLELSPDTNAWARTTFRFSLLALLGFCFALACAPFFA